ncbi:tyrosine-type recombinase/integrase [Paraburkholderia caffeinilytica]|uniref:tyrosine-type recombinase/integrase n=1 Tax=Paraburkholderia caffeinilytica TaxID=1761016 RepID=UPI003DA1A904
MGTRHRIDRHFIRAIAPNGKYQAYQDADLTGFGIKISPIGTVAYTYRWVKPDGTQGRRNIGRWPDLQPGEARERCRREIALLDRKNDSPLQLVERKTQRVAVQKIAGVPTIRAFLDGRYELHLQTKLTQARAVITAKMIRKSFAGLLDKPLDECTAYMIEEWRSDLLKKGLKPSTLNRKLNALRGLFARAVEWEVITASPMKKVKKQDEPGGKVRFLDPEEEQRLYDALDERRALLRAKYGEDYEDAAEVAIVVSLHTGLRRGELFTLCWSDVDLRHAFVTVLSINAKSRRQRHVPLNAEALAILARWKARATNGLVFPNRSGEAPIRDLKAWPEIRSAAKLAVFRWHDMRHHFASRLVMAGVDLNTVRELLGHADLKMTLRYAHLSPGHRARAVRLLERPANESARLAA